MIIVFASPTFSVLCRVCRATAPVLVEPSRTEIDVDCTCMSPDLVLILTIPGHDPVTFPLTIGGTTP